MTFSVFILIITFFSFGLYYSVSRTENKYIRKHIFMFAMLLSIIYILVNNNMTIIFETWVFYSLIFFLLVFSLFFNYISNSNVVKIVANQVTFWNVSSDDSKLKYANLLSSINGISETSKKEKWTELKEVEIPYFYVEEKIQKVFHPKYKKKLLTFIESDSLLTKIDNLEYFNNKNPRLHIMIFQKLSHLDMARHINIDFKYLLFANDFYLEYFLIDLWKIIAKHEALGTGTLEYYCEIEKDYELIGALDNSLKSSIQQRGSFLWSKYIIFKDNVNYE